MTSDPHDLLIYKATLEAAVDAIVVADQNGIIANTNAATLSLFGYERDELIGQNVNILTPDDVAAHHDDYMDHHIKTGETKIIGVGRDLDAKHRDGSVFPVHITIGRAEIDGAPTFVGIIHDLTARRKSQEIAARAQRMDAIGQLTGGVAHDFNNLLTIVIGNLELLEPHLNKQAQKDLLNDALEAATLGADLTSKLLGLSRGGAPETSLFDINDATLSLQSILQRTLGPGIDFQIKLAPEMWEIHADQAAFQTALLNLVLNAKDAMPKGGKLTVETENAKIDDPYIVSETGITAGNYAKISVSDTGLGMDAQTKRRAFEPFYTTKAKGKGTGFGLSMVYGFMQQSNGHATLYSEIGQGTTFSLYFPVAKPPRTDARNTSTTTNQTGHGETVLVVEDDIKVRKLSITRLEELGYTVIDASDGDQALERLKGNPQIAVLFSDIVMPGALSGFQLAAQVEKAYPAVKILLTSGYSESQTPQNGDRKYPMLRKPFRQVELAKALQALLTDT